MSSEAPLDPAFVRKLFSIETSLHGIPLEYCQNRDFCPTLEALRIIERYSGHSPSLEDQHAEGPASQNQESLKAAVDLLKQQMQSLDQTFSELVPMFYEGFPNVVNHVSKMVDSVNQCNELVTNVKESVHMQQDVSLKAKDGTRLKTTLSDLQWLHYCSMYLTECLTLLDEIDEVTSILNHIERLTEQGDLVAAAKSLNQGCILVCSDTLRGIGALDHIRKQMLDRKISMSDELINALINDIYSGAEIKFEAAVGARRHASLRLSRTKSFVRGGTLKDRKSNASTGKSGSGRRESSDLSIHGSIRSKAGSRDDTSTSSSVIAISGLDHADTQSLDREDVALRVAVLVNALEELQPGSWLPAVLSRASEELNRLIIQAASEVFAISQQDPSRFQEDAHREHLSRAMSTYTTSVRGDGSGAMAIAPSTTSTGTGGGTNSTVTRAQEATLLEDFVSQFLDSPEFHEVLPSAKIGISCRMLSSFFMEKVRSTFITVIHNHAYLMSLVYEDDLDGLKAMDSMKIIWREVFYKTEELVAILTQTVEGERATAEVVLAHADSERAKRIFADAVFISHYLSENHASDRYPQRLVYNSGFANRSRANTAAQTDNVGNGSEDSSFMDRLSLTGGPRNHFSFAKEKSLYSTMIGAQLFSKLREASSRSSMSSNLSTASGASTSFFDDSRKPAILQASQHLSRGNDSPNSLVRARTDAYLSLLGASELTSTKPLWGMEDVVSMQEALLSVLPAIRPSIYNLPYIYEPVVRLSHDCYRRISQFEFINHRNKRSGDSASKWESEMVGLEIQELHRAASDLYAEYSKELEMFFDNLAMVVLEGELGSDLKESYNKVAGKPYMLLRVGETGQNENSALPTLPAVIGSLHVLADVLQIVYRLPLYAGSLSALIGHFLGYFNQGVSVSLVVLESWTSAGLLFKNSNFVHEMLENLNDMVHQKGNEMGILRKQTRKKMSSTSDLGSRPFDEIARVSLEEIDHPRSLADNEFRALVQLVSSIYVMLRKLEAPFGNSNLQLSDIFNPNVNAGNVPSNASFPTDYLRSESSKTSMLEPIHSQTNVNFDASMGPSLHHIPSNPLDSGRKTATLPVTSSSGYEGQTVVGGGPTTGLAASPLANPPSTATNLPAFQRAHSSFLRPTLSRSLSQSVFNGIAYQVQNLQKSADVGMVLMRLEVLMRCFLSIRNAAIEFATTKAVTKAAQRGVELGKALSAADRIVKFNLDVAKREFIFHEVDDMVGTFVESVEHILQSSHLKLIPPVVDGLQDLLKSARLNCEMLDFSTVSSSNQALNRLRAKV